MLDGFNRACKRLTALCLAHGSICMVHLLLCLARVDTVLVHVEPRGLRFVVNQRCQQCYRRSQDCTSMHKPSRVWGGTFLTGEGRVGCRQLGSSGHMA